MHGIVLKGLKDFVVENHGLDGWQEVQAEAGLENRLYVPVTEYPDEEAVALVAAACKVTGQRPPDVMEAFGRYIVTPLVETYGVHVDGDWSSMELLANVEEYIHEALRAKQLSEFTPPSLAAERLGEDRVVLYYDSQRELCPLVRGILHGVADHYDETFEIEERECRLEGALRCTFDVERVPEAAEAAVHSGTPAGIGDEPLRRGGADVAAPSATHGDETATTTDPDGAPASDDRGRPTPDGSGIEER